MLWFVTESKHLSKPPRDWFPHIKDANQDTAYIEVTHTHTLMQTLKRVFSGTLKHSHSCSSTPDFLVNGNQWCPRLVNLPDVPLTCRAVIQGEMSAIESGRKENDESGGVIGKTIDLLF